MQPPSVMDRLFALATRLHTSLFPSADPMTASRPAPRALAFPAFVLPALALLMVAALVAVPDAARAQLTPAATIENASSDVVAFEHDVVIGVFDGGGRRLGASCVGDGDERGHH